MLVPYLNSSGVPTDPTTPDTEVSQDGGSFADAAEEVTTITGSNGMGFITLTGAEMNNSAVGVAAKVTSGPNNTLMTLYPRLLPTLLTGTASAGASGSITLAAGAYDLTGCIVQTTGGTGGGGTGGANNQARVITAYSTSTKVATVLPAWETTPDATTTYNILLTECAAVNVQAINGISASSVTAVNANVGTTQPVNFTGTAGSALAKADLGAILATALTETSAGYLAAAFKKLFDVATPTLKADSLTTAALARLVLMFDTDKDSIYDTINKRFIVDASAVPIDLSSDTLNDIWNYDLSGFTDPATTGGALYLSGQVLIVDGVTVTTNNDKTGYALTSAYDPAKTAAQAGDAMALTSGERTALQAAFIDEADGQAVLAAMLAKINSLTSSDVASLQIALAVREQLATELARIDQNISDVFTDDDRSALNAINTLTDLSLPAVEPDEIGGLPILADDGGGNAVLLTRVDSVDENGTADIATAVNSLSLATQASVDAKPTAAQNAAAILAATNGADTVGEQLQAASAGGGTPLSPTFVDDDHTWRFHSRSQLMAPMIVSEIIGFVGEVCMDFSEPLPSAADIATINDFTVSPMEGSPEFGAPAFRADHKGVNILVTTNGDHHDEVLPGNYDVTITVTSDDSQTFVRTGRLILRAP